LRTFQFVAVEDGRPRGRLGDFPEKAVLEIEYSSVYGEHWRVRSDRVVPNRSDRARYYGNEHQEGLGVRIAIFGAGGVGAYFGARLAEVGNEVSIVARGRQLDAIRAHGLRVDSVFGDMLVRPRVASASAADIGPVDAVLLGVKTWQVADVAAALKPLLGRDTFVVPLQNGVDTPDLLANSLGPEHVVGGLCGGFCFIVAPGHVKHIGGVTFIKFGELNGRSPSASSVCARSSRPRRSTSRCRRHSRRALGEADARRAVRRRRRGVARASRVMMKTRETRGLIEAGMREIAAVALAQGVRLSTRRGPAHARVARPHDADGHVFAAARHRGRQTLELDAWTGAVVQSARARRADAYASFLYASLLPLDDAHEASWTSRPQFRSASASPRVPSRSRTCVRD
jgi:2-dehydropantoate 2-reductase